MDSAPSHEIAEAAGGDKSRGVSRQAREALRARDFRKATPLLEAAAAKDPNNLSILSRLAQSLNKVRRKADAASVYRRILELKPDHKRARARLAETDWREGRRSEAMAHFKAAPAPRKPNPNADLLLGQRLLKQWQNDDAEVAFNRVISVEPKNLPALLGLARCAANRMERDEVLTYLRAAAAVQPGNSKIEWRIKRLEQEPARQDWTQEVRDATETLRDEGKPKEERLWAAQRLLGFGITDVILEKLPALQAASAQARRIGQIARQLESSGLSQTAPLLGEVVDPERDQLNAVTGVVERLTPGAEVLMLLFSGRMNRAFLSLDIIHRLLRRTGASLVYLRDLERTNYLGGVVGLGGDFTATTEAFREIRERSGARRLLMFGNCIGCAGALRYGLALGAEAVLGVSPRVGAATAGGLAPATRSKLEALLEATPEYSGALVDLYRTAGAAAPRVTLVAGAGAEPEASFAREMAAETPGVVYAAMPGIFQECFGDILARGLFPPLLSSFVAKGEVAPEVLADLRRPIDDDEFAEAPRSASGVPAREIAS